jgi:cytochrome c-type biogenesis protein CcmH/NrfF
MRRRLVLGVLAGLLVGPIASPAQKPPASGEALIVHPEARAAIGKLKSPYCPGMMLEVCPSPGGAMLRDSIQRMAEEGLAADSIVETILAEYGEEWRAEPLGSGTGRWAWLLPPVAIVLGLVGVASALARRRGPVAKGPTRTAGPEEAARLKAALADLEKEEEPAF